MLGIVVHPNLAELVSAVAAEAAAVLRTDPGGLVAVAPGPLLDRVYDRIAASDPDAFRSAAFVSASELFRAPGEEIPSNRQRLRERLLAPLGIDPERLQSFDPDAPSPERECQRMDEWLDLRGGVLLYLAECDEEGRLGIVQKKASVRSRSHVAMSVPAAAGGDPLFGRPAPKRLGLTLGLQDFAAARRCLVLAQGPAAGASLRRALGGLVSEEYPAAAMRLGRICHLAVDPAAAEEIGDDLLRRFPITPLDAAPDPYAP